MSSSLPTPLDLRSTPRTMSRMSTSLPAMVDLRGDPGGGLSLSWTEAPGARDRAVLPTDLARLHALADAVALAEGREHGIVAAREALSSALFDLLDGPERALRRRIDRAESEGCRLDLVVRARTGDRRALREHPATWMRWELLPYAETRVHGKPPFTVVLQLGPQDQAPPRVLDRGGLRVLFMASSPSDAPELDFEQEEEHMLAALAPFVEHRRARLRVVEGGTLKDLGDALLLERFDVVHLSGHGFLRPEGPRLAMEDAFGGRHLVSPRDLIKLFEDGKAMPALVMVSCCHSAEVRGSVASFAAELVAEGSVPNVLGWTRPVRDDLATLAAGVVHRQLAAGKTPVVAAAAAREAMAKADAQTHAWGTLHLVSGAAGGFRVDDGAPPLSERSERDEVYRFLGSRMRVLETGFVGRRRLVQRLLHVLVRGEELRRDGARKVAGACVFGMKGVGKSCAVGRAIERAKQQAPDLGLVVVHGEIGERSVLEAFQEGARAAGDEAAEKALGRADVPVFDRVRRVMDLWRRRPAAIVLDDFERHLEPRSDGPWLLAPGAAALLDAVLPGCVEGKPRLLITSTAAFEMPARYAQALVLEPLGAFDARAVQKLWMRGQASNDLGSVTLGSFQDLAERLGRNPRILAWARALCGRKADAELAEVAARAKAALPVWGTGDEADEGKRAELAALFLRHMAYDEARAAFGEGALAFVKRARVFEEAVPKEGFAALVEGLGMDVGRDLDALASWGLMEVGELDGARAYRVSPLVEARFEAEDAARWHEAAAEVWEGLAGKASDGERLERTRMAWEHALEAGKIERADRLARRIDTALYNAGLYAENLRLAERHVEALPESPFGHQWAGYAGFKAGRLGPRATERVQKGLALLIRSVGTEEHPAVAASLHELGGVLQAQGDLAGARRALERSLDITAKVLGTEEHPDVAATLHALGGVLKAQGDLAGARRALERSLDIQAKVLGTEEHPSVATTYDGLGAVLVSEGRSKEAVAAYQRALTIREKCFGTRDHYMSAETEVSLARLLFKLGRVDEARELFQHAVQVLAEQVPNHPILQQLRAQAEEQPE
jgi:tetratricopeptide (TPR) repeat protein